MARTESQLGRACLLEMGLCPRCAFRSPALPFCSTLLGSLAGTTVAFLEVDFGRENCCHQSYFGRLGGGLAPTGESPEVTLAGAAPLTVSLPVSTEQ